MPAVSVKLKDSIQTDAVKVKALALDVDGAESFAELAAVALAARFEKVGRVRDARRILKVYLAKHQATHRVASRLQALG